MNQNFETKKRFIHDLSYNERLFSHGIRKWFHMARFRWLEKICNRFNNLSTDVVLELGCFDARSIDFIKPAPKFYHGYDAGWEGGLELAAEKYKNCPTYYFRQATTESDILPITNPNPTLVISLETLEHIPSNLLVGYLEKLSSLTQGYFVVTVPNEKGLIFLAKWIIKRFLPGGQQYKLGEVFWATLGRLDRVERQEHKGFDYANLHREICRFFQPILIEGVQFPSLPLWMNVQIGMVYKAMKS